MKISLRRALWVGTVATMAVSAVPVTAALGAGSLTSTFAVSTDWGTGHEAKVTVTNGTSAAVNSWRIEFDLPSGTSISIFWDADVTRTGNHYVAVQKSWAGPLAPGASFSWGYNGVGRVPGAAQLHDQRRLLRRWHPAADHDPTDHQTAHHRAAHHRATDHEPPTTAHEPP